MLNHHSKENRQQTSPQNKTKGLGVFVMLSGLFVLLLVATFASVGVFFSSSLQSYSRDEFLDESNIHLTQQTRFVNFLFNNIRDMNTQMANSNRFNRLISPRFSEDLTLYERRTELLGIVEPLQRSYSYVDNIVFVSNDQFSVGTPVSRFLSIDQDEFLDKALYELAWQDEDKMVWLGPNFHPIFSPIRENIMILKAYRNGLTGQPAGMILTMLNPDIIENALKEVRIGETGHLFLVDQEGALVYRPQSEELDFTEAHYLLAYQTLSEALAGGTYDYKTPLAFELNHHDYVIQAEKLLGSDWHMIAIADTRQFTILVRQLQETLFVTLLVAAVILLPVLLRITSGLLNPIGKIRDAMEQYQSGERKTRIDGHFSFEFRTLGDQFNTMADQIDQDFQRIESTTAALREREQELESFNEELEQRVLDRTQELETTNSYLEESLAQNEETQAELLVTQDELERSLDDLKQTQMQLIISEKNAALGQILAGISHNVNTPLGTVRTSASYLMQLIEDLDTDFSGGQLTRKNMANFFEKARDTGDIQAKSLTRAIELLDQFKHVAKLQTSTDRSSVHIEERLEELIGIYRHIHTHVDFQLKITDVRMAHIPDDLLLTTLDTLINNTMIHGLTEDHDHPQFTLTIQRQHQNDLYMEYCDNGRGVSDQALSKLFEPFSTTTFGQGQSGLGLFILHNRIKSLGGMIKARTLNGETTGLCIEISLPNVLEPL